MSKKRTDLMSFFACRAVGGRRKGEREEGSIVLRIIAS